MIGFVNICHEDYVSGTSETMAEKAVAALAEAGVDVFRIAHPVTDSLSAENAGRELVKNGADGVILFLGTWMECPTAMSVIREIEHLPMCLWGFPMFPENGAMSSTGSYVSFAMFKGTMDRVGYRYKPVLGLPDDPAAIKSVQSFCAAAEAAARLKRARIGLVGYTSMGIYPGTFDHVFMRAKIGPEIEQTDSYSVIALAESLKDEDFAEMAAYLRQAAKIRDDVSQADLDKAARLAEALRRISAQKRLIGMNVKCQYEFSKEYKAVMCVPLSALAEFGIVSSCEGDIPNTVSMLILSLISGKVCTYGDVIDHRGSIVKLSSCGFVPFSFGDPDKREIRKFMPHPGFHGIQNSFVISPGRVTFARLVEDRCDYHIVYATGEGVETELRQGYMPALDVKLDGSVDRLVANFAGQHYAICRGDLSAELEDLAVILGIRCVKI